MLPRLIHLHQHSKRRTPLHRLMTDHRGVALGAPVVASARGPILALVLALVGGPILALVLALVGGPILELVLALALVLLLALLLALVGGPILAFTHDTDHDPGVDTRGLMVIGTPPTTILVMMSTITITLLEPEEKENVRSAKTVSGLSATKKMVKNILVVKRTETTGSEDPKIEVKDLAKKIATMIVMSSITMTMRMTMRMSLAEVATTAVVVATLILRRLVVTRLCTNRFSRACTMTLSRVDRTTECFFTQRTFTSTQNIIFVYLSRNKNDMQIR